MKKLEDLTTEEIEKILKGVDDGLKHPRLTPFKPCEDRCYMCTKIMEISELYTFEDRNVYLSPICGKCYWEIKDLNYEELQKLERHIESLRRIEVL